MDAERGPVGLTLTYLVDRHGFGRRHERETRAAIAGRLAALKGYRFAGEYPPPPGHAGPVYLVPSDTLVGHASAEALSVRTEDDLFGAVVPHPFVATKAITHPLVAPDAVAPPGWSHGLATRLRESTLEGFATFSPADARRAGALLLEGGPVRVKPVRATGGRGQEVAAGLRALEAILDATDPADLARDGVVLERNLTEVTTHSVGQIRVAGMVASYWGTQRLTPDNDGQPVYGGSDLLVARGGFEALHALGLSDSARIAVARARRYDAAAQASFPSLLASRRNYDVAEGRDPLGRIRCGVLEQSWRLGGASGAEVAALEAFAADPALPAIRTFTLERYGGAAEPPPGGATVYFHGTDEEVGPITKIAGVRRDGDA
jgi:hypothetical protein